MARGDSEMVRHDGMVARGNADMVRRDDEA